MRRLPPAAALAAALLMAACRSPPDDLAGAWSGDLACEEDGLSYGTAVTMNLETPSDGRHPGTLALLTTWTGSDGVDYRQSTAWVVALVQDFPRGAQDVKFVQADCADALRMGADDPVAEGCEEIGGGIGTGSLAWDGADTLTWGGACTGTLVRGAIDGDTGDPSGGAR